ncbi:TonB-dependent receptor domain-containing protein [Sphingomonas sp.]|uniref:TonB-dependent receptor domain-containing protein n=1 Tax=Sphingomonas sp. TaxID=28214 RepID=UPI0028AB3AE1|nr:TonB-dependent receptor [Sphingomonas sp.]
MSRFRKPGRTGLNLAASSLALIVASPLVAQAQQGNADGAAPQADAAPDTGNDIVVTGSRIRRPDYETASPIVSFGAQTLQQAGTTNVTDFLQGIPALVGSQTSRDNSGDRAGIGATGLNLVDLRNLGTNRTLVLVDGRRHVSSLPGTQSVDINTIPTDLIERIDILTGGASAIYGADGVTGVVNFLIKKDFQGVTARAQANVSKYGDAGQRLFSLTAGQNFAGGRGNVAVAYEYNETDRLRTVDRGALIGTTRTGFYRNPDYVAGQSGSYNYIPQSGVRYGQTSRYGAVDVDFDGLPDFVGTGRVYNRGIDIPGGYTRNSDDTLVSDYGNDLLPSSKRHVVNAFAHFDVSDKLTLFAEGKYANTKSYSLGQPTFDYYLFVPQDNPYIPAPIAAAIDPANGGVLVTRDNFDLGQRGENIKRETYRSVIGAKGDLSPSLHYEISYVFGQTNITNRFVNDIYSDRFFAALDAVRNPANGQITCRVNLDPTWTPDQPYSSGRTVLSPTTFKPGECQPINLFGENVTSQAGLDFIRANTTERSRLRQNVVSGSISGDLRDLFTLPGGAIGYALGAEYRKESSRFTPDLLEQQGLTFSNKLLPTRGSYDVKEVFGEIDVPLLKDRPFFQTLDVAGALRFSDYSSIGHTTTWKADATWAPIRDVRFRGTISKAVRAPNIGELYDAASQTFAFFDDPCIVANRTLGKSTRAANCQAILSAAGLNAAQIASYDDPRNFNISGTSGGNPNLAPEEARTWTAGVVLQPSFLRGFQLSLDWYNINIKNAINTVDPQQLAELCVDQATINNPFCATIQRQQGTGLINGFTVSPQNVANFKTAGLDANLNYSFSIDKVGAFNIHVVASYLDRLTFVGTPGAEATDNLRQAYMPRLQAFTNLTYSTGKFSFNYSLSWWDKTYRYPKDRLTGNPNYVAPEYAFFKERWMHNIYASVDVDKRFQLYGGVTNLFDQKPDLGALLYPTDWTGRSGFVGARVKF